MILTPLRKAKTLSVLFFTLAAFAACEKFDESALGNDMLPPGDRFSPSVFDTLTLTTSTLRADSLVTDELTAHLAGMLNDPVFGRTTAGMYTQLLLNTANYSDSALAVFANAEVDSVVLSMVYSGFYGDSTSAVDFKVYEVIRDYYRDSIYFSTKQVEVNPTVLNESEGAVQVRPNTPVVIDGQTLSPQLRIKLRNDVGRRLLDAGKDNLRDNAAFVKFFRGIYLVAGSAAGTGILVKINPIVTASGLTVYYHRNDTQEKGQMVLTTNGTSARFTTFSHNFEATPAGDQLNGSVSGNELVYVQSNAGTKVEIQMPYLEKLKDLGNIVINKAELVLPAVPQVNPPVAAHDRLLLQVLDATGKREVVPDLLELGDGHFLGYYVPNDSSYHMIITKYIQSVISGKRGNHGMQVIASNAGVNANRTILAGALASGPRPKLIITYTKP